jgi:hypothetical protein
MPRLRMYCNVEMLTTGRSLQASKVLALASRCRRSVCRLNSGANSLGQRTAGFATRCRIRTMSHPNHIADKKCCALASPLSPRYQRWKSSTAAIRPVPGVGSSRNRASANRRRAAMHHKNSRSSSGQPKICRKLSSPLSLARGRSLVERGPADCRPPWAANPFPLAYCTGLHATLRRSPVFGMAGLDGDL